VTEVPPASPGGDSRRNSALVAAGIFLSRITGLVRERALGHYFGGGLAVEAFRAALRIPNMMQNLLGEGVLSASFIPVYSRLLAEGREEEAGKVAGAIAGLLAAVAGALVVVGVVFARPLTTVIAFGFTGDKLDLTVDLVRILTPGIGFLVLSAWCLGVLNSHRRFFLSYVAPVLWNAAMIATLLAFGLRGVEAAPLAVALAWGTFAGGVLQFAVQLPGVIRLSRGLRPSLRTDLPGVRTVIRTTGPVIAGRGVVQLSGYVDLFLASFLATGAVAALGYAQVLYMLPVSLFGMSVAAAELPELSSQTDRDSRAVVQRLERGLARIAFFVVPTIVVYLVIGDLVIGTLYQSGRFGPDDSVQVWAVLAAYSLGLLASTASRLLQSSLYGVGDTKTPALYATIRVVLSASLGALLMLQLDRVELTTAGFRMVGDVLTLEPVSAALRDSPDNLFRLGGAGLALGAGIFAWLEFRLLQRAVARRFGAVRLAGGRLGPIAVAAAVAAVVALLGRLVVAGLPPLLGGPLAAGAAGAAYIAVASRFGVSELDSVVRRLRRR
jgi:putative peptidoglycan lipid II flippase